MSAPSINHSNVTRYTSPTGGGVVVVNVGDTLTANLYKEVVVQCEGKETVVVVVVVVVLVLLL